MRKKNYICRAFLIPVAVVMLLGCGSQSSVSSETKGRDAATVEGASITLDPDWVSAGSLNDPSATVDFRVEATESDGVRILMTRSDPRAGDYVAMTIPLQNLPVGQGVEIALDLTNPYHNENTVGRGMVYQVLLNDRLLLQEDVALNGDMNQVRIQMVPEHSEAKLVVRVTTSKDLRPWNWGTSASPVIVHRVGVRQDPQILEWKVTSSSPDAEIL